VLVIGTGVNAGDGAARRDSTRRAEVTCNINGSRSDNRILGLSQTSALI